MKGETVEELIGFAQVMRQKVVRIHARGDDVAGMSGTDRRCSSTRAAPGRRHRHLQRVDGHRLRRGRRRLARGQARQPLVSSLCGSADVVETLGISSS